MLEVLAGTEGWLGVTQIARLGERGTRQGLTLALDRLVEQGLVLAQQGTRGHLYKLNREHVRADSVLSATRARLTVLARLTGAVEVLSPQPVHVSVFGSFARKEAGPDSDIDLLVVLASGQELEDQFYSQLRDLGDHVRAWTGNRLQYLLFNLDGFAGAVRSGEGIVQSWLQDCVTLVGDPIERLVQQVRESRRREES